jgi:hypothetical protein
MAPDRREIPIDACGLTTSATQPSSVRPSNSGNRAMLTAIQRASSFVGTFAWRASARGSRYKHRDAAGRREAGSPQSSFASNSQVLTPLSSGGEYELRPKTLSLIVLPSRRSGSEISSPGAGGELRSW